MEDLKLLGKRVLVKKPQEQEEVQRESGIFVPTGTSQSDYIVTSEIVSIGKDCEHVGEGEVAVFDKRGGMEIEFGEETYKLLQEDNIIATKKK